METRTNLLADILGAGLFIAVAYFSIHFGESLGEKIDSTDVMRTFLFLFFIGMTARSIKQTVVDFAKLLREDADG